MRWIFPPKNRCKKLQNGSLPCGGIFDLATKEQEVEQLEKQIAAPNFWEDPESAKGVMDTCNRLKLWTVPYQEIQKRFRDVQELFPEALAIGDGDLVQELSRELVAVEQQLSELEVRKMLAGELDGKHCYLEINAGAGGTESCDWALMLSRMYQRYASRKGWKAEIIDRLDGDIAGIKSITFRFSGPFAFGYCKSERGVHRLVRISPFDSNARRHTSFASVDVTPVVEDIQVEVRPEEIHVDTFRASGAGGQHVNKTDSAVRITHVPSGIVVACQSERSQVQNRETCMKMLRSKLYEKEYNERRQKIAAMGGEKKDIAWGSQIRNYVLQPYTLVKDTRTKVEIGNVQEVLDGGIEPFVTAYLKELD